MNEKQGWKIFSKIVTIGDIAYLNSAFRIAAMHIGPNTRPSAWEAWVRRCHGAARKPHVDHPESYFVKALKYGPDKDLDATSPMASAISYQDYEPYEIAEGAEPDWSVALSIKVYQYVAYGGPRPRMAPEPPPERQEAGIEAVKSVIADWRSKGRPCLDGYDWKAAVHAHRDAQQDS